MVQRLRKVRTRKTFSEEVKPPQNQQVVKSQSVLRALMPKTRMDENGVLRVNGRLSLVHALPYNTRYPIIFPRRHPVTRLIVNIIMTTAIICNGHGSYFTLISQKYWIVHGREEIRKCEKGCMERRRKKAKAASQVMAPLARSIGTVSLIASDKVSVNYAGPSSTIQGRGKVRQKRYICLFVCLTTRAVHCEMAYSLDTYITQRSYTSRREKPKQIISDNNSNFICAERELKTLVKTLDKAKIDTCKIETSRYN